MSWNFPNAPTVGQQFVPPGSSSIFTWDGTAWKMTPGSNAGLVISDNPPPNPVVGMFWWESDSGNTFVWYDDGDSRQWVQINHGPGSGGSSGGGGPTEQDHITSPVADMWAGFKTGTPNRFSVNSESDGTTGTDVLWVGKDGAFQLSDRFSVGVGGGTTVYPNAGSAFHVADYASPNYYIQLRPESGSGASVRVGGAYLSFYANSVLCAQMVASGGPALRLLQRAASTLVCDGPSATQNYGVYTTGVSLGGAAIGYIGGIFGALSMNVGGEGTWTFYGNSSAKVSTGSWVTCDETTKTAIRSEDPNTALAAVLAVPVVSYESLYERLGRKSDIGIARQDNVPVPIDTVSRTLGFRAQDIEPHVPYAVRDSALPAADLLGRAVHAGLDHVPEQGTEEADELAAAPITEKILKESVMLATLWSAVQALSAQVTDLQAQLAARP